MQAPNFQQFRNVFRAKLGRNFLVPAATFDNVKGKFPAGFFIWDLEKKDIFTQTQGSVFNKDGDFIGYKTLLPDNGDSIND